VEALRENAEENALSSNNSKKDVCSLSWVLGCIIYVFLVVGAFGPFYIHPFSLFKHAWLSTVARELYLKLSE